MKAYSSEAAELVERKQVTVVDNALADYNASSKKAALYKQQEATWAVHKVVGVLKM